MEISGPACDLRINDNPDNYNIQKEMNAINEDTPDWDKDIGEGLFMGKPVDYWIELDNHARKIGIEDVALENAKLRKRITTLEKRWKALRKYLRSYLPGALFPVQVTNKMTKITRKIK